jgi:hypothetical protein
MPEGTTIASYRYPKTRRQTEITARKPLAAVKKEWISK